MTYRENADRDVFVNTADLTISRPPPDKRAGFADIIRGRNFQVAVSVLFMLVVSLFWRDIRSALLDSNILVDDSNRAVTTIVETPDGPTEVPLEPDLPSITSVNASEGFALGLIISLPFALMILVRSLMIMANEGIPFYRNIIFIRDITQVAILLLLIVSAYTLFNNLQDNFADPTRGLKINVNVLSRDDFGVEISQGPNYQEEITWLQDVPLIGESLSEIKFLQPNTYSRALMTGIYNTIRVVIGALFAATVLGVLVGVGLLSNNWLVRVVSSVYVEIFRNTPLLVQLFLIYGVWTRILPNVADSIVLPGPVYLNKRGLNYPKIESTDTFTFFLFFAVIGLGGAIYLWRQRMKLQEETGEPARATLYASASFFGLALVGILVAVVAGGFPFSATPPEPIEEVRFNIREGDVLSAEYVGLFLTLVLYTAAFIADIVRAGIQSVPKGQIEAARAAGLSGGQTLQLVVLPQAFRLIVPPLTNQYLNLSKNSSLAIAVGYTDLFNVSTIASNQSGQAVVFFGVVLVLYLLMSLLISAIMNYLNRGLRLKTR